MGNPIAGWQDAYYMCLTTSITQVGDMSSETEEGTYGDGMPIVYLRNHPTFELNKGIISARKATGRPYLIKGGSTRIERTPGTVAPTTSFEIDFDQDSCWIPLYTFFQALGSGLAATGHTAIQTFQPYTSASTTAYASLLRVLEEGQSHQIVGAIPNSITIKGEEGDSIQMTVDWTGADMVTGQSSAVANWTTSDSETFLLFQDMTCLYESTGSTNGTAEQTVDLVGFEITMTNNIVAKHYDNPSIQRYILGDLEVTGTLRVPWSSSSGGKNDFITRLYRGDDFKVVLYWGAATPATDGDVAISLNIEVDTAQPTGGEDEAINEVAFTGVYDGTTYPIKIEVLSDIDRDQS